MKNDTEKPPTPEPGGTSARQKEDGVVEVENLTELSEADFAAHMAVVIAEAARRRTLPAAEKIAPDPEPLIGPDEACALLQMKKRKLYALEAAGKLPFARSRSQKDRAYDKAGLLKWRDRQRAA